MKFSGLFPLRTIPSTQSEKMWSAKKSCHTQSFKMSHTGRDIPMSRVLHPRPEEESLWVDDKSNDDVEKRIVLMPSTWCDCLEGRLPTGAHKLPPLILTCEICKPPPSPPPFWVYKNKVHKLYGEDYKDLLHLLTILDLLGFLDLIHISFLKKRCKQNWSECMTVLF